ncbi:nitrogenase component 1 [Desulfococcus sp.]|uniref:nitrogenase component 1 n=1 Tax=Desulfococcus sp. TaxID=2025834 RepID=UPI00359477F4
MVKGRIDMNKTASSTKDFTATQNACKLCSPLGAALVFKGIRGAVPLLHGSQGCSTYIRRYLISHFKEPMDIACSNFAEETAIFGGGANLKIALENIRRQYAPAVIGVATTCLSETIGDDVPMFLREYRAMFPGEELPPVIHVSTPSYQGTHMDGFHGAVLETVAALTANPPAAGKSRINLFPGMVSPEDLRHLKEILGDAGIPATVLPDYSKTLDGGLWTEYQRIPEGGTEVADIRRSGTAAASLEFGRILAEEKKTAGTFLEKEFNVPCRRLGLPIGIRETDRFFDALTAVTGQATPEKYIEERGRLTDALVDGHKIVNLKRAVVYGEEDLVAGVVSFLAEIGILPVLCASGGKSGRLEKVIAGIFPDYAEKGIQVMDNADFVDIESAAQSLAPDLIIGHSKGYTMARRLKVPLVRIGFPVHDRVGGARILHLGYRGALQLFDRITNTLIERQQDESAVGYTYM